MSRLTTLIISKYIITEVHLSKQVFILSYKQAVMFSKLLTAFNPPTTAELEINTPHKMFCNKKPSVSYVAALHRLTSGVTLALHLSVFIDLCISGTPHRAESCTSCRAMLAPSTKWPFTPRSP